VQDAYDNDVAEQARFVRAGVVLHVCPILHQRFCVGWPRRGRTRPSRKRTVW
jgi:hypothetical protein